MVRLPGEDLVRAKELLQEHDPRELVRQRDAAQGQAPLRALDHGGVEPERAAHDEAQIRSREAPLRDEFGEPLDRELLTLPIERHHVCALRNPLENAVRLPQLAHLEACLAAQQPLIVSHVVHEGRPDLSHADEEQAHRCDTSEDLAEENERERHINMHMSPEAMAGAYANFANISHSDYEFTVTFARLDHEVDEDEIPGVVVSRISASPKFVRELIDALEDNYSKWSTREGIKNLPEYRGGDQGGDERSHSSTA